MALLVSLFKPNLRGVRRHSIRFTWRGWRYTDTTGIDWLIEFNWPWRRSWPTRLEANKVVLQSRSGETYLAIKAEQPPQQSSGHQASRAKFLPLLVLPLIAGAFLVWPVEVKPQNAKGILPRNETCQSLLSNADSAIDAWLANSSTGRLSFTQLEQFELGGVRELIVLAECENQQQKFSVQVAKQGEVWRLSKTSRLAN